MAVTNPDEDDKPFTPELLESLAKRTEEFRLDTLFDVDGDSGADFIAQQHYLAALGHLELAHREFKLAMYHQRRALGAARGYR